LGLELCIVLYLACVDPILGFEFNNICFVYI
jgi:hypothetical protein